MIKKKLFLKKQETKKVLILNSKTIEFKKFKNNRI